MVRKTGNRPLRVFTAGATREGLRACVQPFFEATGISVEAPTDHGHIIRTMVIDGRTDADAVMLPAHMIDDLTRRGLVSPNDQATIGTIRVGAAVRDSSALPDVRTLPALERTLRAAASIVITEAPSGRHMDAVIEEMGLRQELEDRITRYDTGTMVNEHIVRSRQEAEIAFGVATEILYFRDKGVRYAGPIPDAVQMAHVYRSGRLIRSERRNDLRLLFDYLSTADAKALFAETGVENGGT